MKLGRIEIDRAMLRSRIASRIFLLFLFCALLPIATFSLLSYARVSHELERDAHTLLRAESKQLGMSLVHRLRFVDSLFRSLAVDSQPGTQPAFDDLSPGLSEASRTWLAELQRLTPEELFAAPPIPDLAPRNEAEWAHLERGGTLLRVASGPSGIARLYLLRRTTAAERPWLVARVRTEELWRDLHDPRTRHLSVLTEQGVPIFATHPQHVSRQQELVRSAGRSVATAWETDGERFLAGAWSAFLRPIFWAPAWVIVHSRSEADVLEPLSQFRTDFPLVALLSLLGVLLLSLTQIRRSLVPIELLHTATRRIAEQDFSARVQIQSRDEFHDLGDSFNAMATRIERHFDVMATVNSIGMSLSAEGQVDAIVETILHGAMRLSEAEGGALFLIGSSGGLEPSRLEMTSAAPATLPARLARIAAQAVAQGRTLYPENSRTAERGGAEAVEPAPDCERYAVLCIPMLNHESETIGALQLIRSHDATAAVPEPFSDEAVDVARSLASQAAVVITTSRLTGAYKDLFEALIELIVKAIDEKSPYTGDHCRRVPILTEMIMEAACDTTTGLLKDFRLSEDERYELRIAALLHDCGKVTTPVHVIDKATKLETIIDRIDLIDTRFEVLARDAEIRLLRERLAEVAPGDEPSAERLGAYRAELSRLHEEREFLRRCNVGGESMSAGDQERVLAIGRESSWRAPSGREEPLLSDDEIENLTVSRGTLTRRERDVIDYHVVATTRLLEELPYPRSLRNVPAIAGAHHERLDGSGYPDGLEGRQLSMQARILGLADVFEALTAVDRPYKRGMPLSRSLAILREMCEAGQIDADLFDLFVREKLYLRYAQEYLDPEQIDEDGGV